MQPACDTRTHARAPEPVALPLLRSVPATAPLRWLRDGARDMRCTPVASGAAGAAVAVLGALLVSAGWGSPHLAPALLGGFLIVAPFLGLGLCATSQQLERDGPVDPVGAWLAWRENAGAIALFGGLLLLAYVFWERGAAILFALHYADDPLPLRAAPVELLLSGRYDTLLLSYFGFGALVAAAVFVVSVVTVPLLLDEPVDTLTALGTSVRCCVRNPGATAVWALLIAALTAVGFATALFGLVAIFPWLAHASWHAYRDMVVP